MKHNKKFLITYLHNYLSIKKDYYFELEYIESVPKKLYRFRACTDNDFNAIDNEYIWLSLASEFSDIKDSALKFNFHYQKNEIIDIYLDWIPFLLKTELKKKFPKMDLSRLNINRELIDEYYNNVFNKNGNYNKKSFKYYMISKGIKSIDLVKIEQYLENLLSQEYIEKVVESSFDKLKREIEGLRNYYYVTCFTETFENDNLWEIYSKEYTGFCIEYDLSTVEDQDKQNLLLNFSPMIYGKKEPVKIADSFRIAEMECCNEDYDKSLMENMNVQLELQIRTKSKTYDHEKEWRFYQKKDTIDCRKFNFPFISRIILGKDIKQKNKARLLNIAKRNNFEVYQQEYDLLTSSFRYNRIGQN
jgi:hypothetical protein